MIGGTITLVLLASEHRVYLSAGAKFSLIATYSPDLSVTAELSGLPISSWLSIAKLSQASFGAIARSKLSDIALSVASSLARCGVDPRSTAFTVLDVESNVAHDNKIQLTALAACFQFAQFRFVDLLNEFAEDGALARLSPDMIWLSAKGIRHSRATQHTSSEWAKDAQEIDDCVSDLKAALEADIFFALKDDALGCDSGGDDVLRTRAKIAVDRLVCVGDFDTEFRLSDTSHKSEGVFNALQSRACHDLIVTLVDRLKRFCATHDVTLLSFDESVFSSVLPNERRIGVVEAVQMGEMDASINAGDWLLGLNCKENFRGAMSMMSRFDAERQVVVLGGRAQRQDAPVMLPSSFVDDRELEVKLFNERGVSATFIPSSLNIQIEPNIVCHVRLVRSVTYATTFELNTSVTPLYRLVLCHRSNNLIGVNSTGAMSVLTDGFSAAFS